LECLGRCHDRLWLYSGPRVHPVRSIDRIFLQVSICWGSVKIRAHGVRLHEQESLYYPSCSQPQPPFPRPASRSRRTTFRFLAAAEGEPVYVVDHVVIRRALRSDYDLQQIDFKHQRCRPSFGSTTECLSFPALYWPPAEPAGSSSALPTDRVEFKATLGFPSGVRTF
jgi:hypothetical protein